jgi:hypothetical protein
MTLGTRLAKSSTRRRLVEKSILHAMEQDQYEAVLGPALGLYKQRQALFEAING